MRREWTEVGDEMTPRVGRAPGNFAGNYDPRPPSKAPAGLRWARSMSSGWYLEVDDGGGR
jgi:hypothetical protein